MYIINLWAWVAMLINNVFALISFIGSLVLLLAAIISRGFHRRARTPGNLGPWSVACLVLGLLGQIAIVIAGKTGEQIGVFFPLSFGFVSLIFFLALAMFALRFFLVKLVRI
jgi:hypothetical protein